MQKFRGFTVTVTCYEKFLTKILEAIVLTSPLPVLRIDLCDKKVSGSCTLKNATTKRSESEGLHGSEFTAKVVEVKLTPIMKR